jgi:RNA polymerase sigma factor (sigma-70 family)
MGMRKAGVSPPAANEMGGKTKRNAQFEPPSGRQDIEQLFDEHNDALLCFINARLHSWTEAKDVAQEAYVKLLGLDESRAVSYLQAYLYRIASNLITDRIRKREVRIRHEHLVFFDESDRERAIPTAESASIEQQEREKLQYAVAELPARMRLVFTLVELEGKSVQSVADHLRIKPDTVRQFVYRSYEYLAEALSDQMLDVGGRNE